ncbi:MAG: efflux RND transporter permease subunit [Pseudomonadota bacterium]
MNLFRLILGQARLVTLLIILLPIVAGTYAYQTLPKEGEPEISAPIAIVVAPYPGASPGEMESLVTNPLEESLSDIKDIKEMRSTSSEGVSVIVVEFSVDADLERSIQKAREKVNEARSELPDDLDDPKVEEINLSDLPIMLVSVVGDLDPVLMKRLAEDAADKLELLPEVLSCEVTGGRTREIQIYLNPERLNQYGLTVLDVLAAVKSSDVNIPGGLVNLDRRRMLLRTMTEVKDVRDYAKVPLLRQGDRVVFLGDVGRVIDGGEEDLTFSRVNGRSSASIGVKKRPGANILETSRKVRERVGELEKGFPAGTRTVITADQGKYINQGFDVMNNSAIGGLAVVIFVLYFFMGLRNSVITSLSIPLSLFMTFVLLKVFGLTNNNMVRFSLVLCIGLLVDNAIIVVENSYHHYQLGKDRLTAVIDGTSEIAMPVISATLTTMAAFLPLLLMSGTVGEYMSFLPKTVNIALVSSLVVALVANPLVLSRFMKRTVRQGQVVRPDEESKLVKRTYTIIASAALNHKAWVIFIALAGLVWAGGLFGMKYIQVEMFPDIDFDFIYITVEAPPGTEVEVTDGLVRRVEKIIEDQVPERVRVVSTVGTRPQSAFEITVGTGLESNFAEVTVELTDGHEFFRAGHQEIQDRIRPFLEAIPGAKIRFRPLSWGPPRFAPVVVKISGPELDVLRGLSSRVKNVLAGIPGAIDIQDDFSDAPPELRVIIDRAAAAGLGVSLEGVALSLRGATAGLEVRDFRDELDVSKKYKVLVRYAPEARVSPSLLDRIKVRSAAGPLVPLSNVARFEQGPGINAIRHIDRRRVVRVTAQNEGRTAVEVAQDLEARLPRSELPEGYSFDLAGDYSETEESFASLKLAYLIAFLLIFALLVAQFNSYFQPFAIMTALPLSVIGALFGLLVTGNNFSIMSFVGLVGLTGIVVNDSIVLVDCINRFRKEGRDIFEAVLMAGQQRLRPIISTTITTIGGIITLTITDKLWEGLGVVIIFGIGFATLLTLVVVPVMYSLFESLGLNVVSAFKGPLVLDPPDGRSFYYTRRRFARLVLVAVLILQAAVLAAGVYYLGPLWLAQVQDTAVQAPTPVKIAIEGAVFWLSVGFEVVLGLALLLTPTWLGLIWLMNRRSWEGYYLAVNSRGLVLTQPEGRLEYPASQIRRVKLSRLGSVLSFQVGPRWVRLRRMVEKSGRPANPPLSAWLKTRPPSRGVIKAGMAELTKALENLKRNDQSEGRLHGPNQ